MSDGVSISTGPTVHQGVLMELIGSSQSVQARIAEYQTAKSEAEKALAALKLGKDVQAARDEAVAKAADASALKDKAKQDADAAAATLRDAQAKANAVLAEAQTKAQTLMAEIDNAKADHAQSVATATADLKTKQTTLTKAQAIFERDKEKVLTATNVAQAEARQAKDAANAAEADFKERAAKLSAALAKISS